MCRRELEKFPTNIHILQVEQEVEGDDLTVLQHILYCDTEREKLLATIHEIETIDEATLSPEEMKENTLKLQATYERYKVIQGEKAESKAIKILTGLGFN